MNSLISAIPLPSYTVRLHHPCLGTSSKPIVTQGSICLPWRKCPFQPAVVALAQAFALCVGLLGELQTTLTEFYHISLLVLRFIPTGLHNFCTSCLCQSKEPVNSCKWSLLWLIWLTCASKLGSSACKQVLQTVAVCGQSEMKNTLPSASFLLHLFTADRDKLGSGSFSWFRQKSQSLFLSER